MRPADALAFALDPSLFAAYVLPRLPNARTDAAPDPWQTEMLRSPARFKILLCCRQSGKSTTTAIVAAHEAGFQPGSTVVEIAGHWRQAAELFGRTRAVLDVVADAFPVKEASAARVELENGSRILCLPGNAEGVRGYSPNLVIFDEAAFADDALFLAVRPMLLQTGGRIVLLSSPNGRRGFFHEVWARGDWASWRVRASECPRISAEELAAARRDMPGWRAAQELDCEFVDAVGQYFSSADIDAAFDPSVSELEITL